MTSIDKSNQPDTKIDVYKATTPKRESPIRSQRGATKKKSEVKVNIQPRQSKGTSPTLRKSPTRGSPVKAMGSPGRGKMSPIKQKKQTQLFFAYTIFPVFKVCKDRLKGMKERRCTDKERLREVVAIEQAVSHHVEAIQDF